MDNAIAKAIQRDAADALLDIGISIALKEFKLPLRKRPIKLRVTLKRPYMSGQIRFARTYLSMGVTYEEMDKFTKEQQMQFVATHGHKIAPVKSLFVRPVAWFIRNCVEQRFLLGGMRKFVSLMGTDPFLPIIRSVERTNPMKPRLSREANGS